MPACRSPPIFVARRMNARLPGGHPSRPRLRGEPESERFVRTDGASTDRLGIEGDDMAKSRSERSRRHSANDRLQVLEERLTQLTKTELVELTLALARQIDGITQHLEKRLKVERPLDRLVDDIASGIRRATAFDKRLINCDFDFDWDAYEEVEQGLRELVERGELDEAMALALDLMKRGSLQVESSDQGLMADPLCMALIPVIEGVERVGGPIARRWAAKMREADRIKSLCDVELASLQGDS